MKLSRAITGIAVLVIVVGVGKGLYSGRSAQSPLEVADDECDLTRAGTLRGLCGRPTRRSTRNISYRFGAGSTWQSGHVR